MQIIRKIKEYEEGQARCPVPTEAGSWEMMKNVLTGQCPVTKPIDVLTGQCPVTKGTERLEDRTLFYPYGQKWDRTPYCPKNGRILNEDSIISCPYKRR